MALQFFWSLYACPLKGALGYEADDLTIIRSIGEFIPRASKCQKTFWRGGGVSEVYDLRCEGCTESVHS